MIPIFQNGTCDPFHPSEQPCTLGNLAQYSVNATDSAQVKAAVEFSAANNIRFVIKNTGHDFLGRSTAAGALGIWTYNMDDVDIIKDYTSPKYNGPAMKMGAGTQAWKAYDIAHSEGYRVMGGACPTVGLAGGFAQGGGHGVLSSEIGLGADNALEWEIITATGELVKATPTENSDLFWAISGGGGGTFGAVVSMTTKLYPEAPTTGGVLKFNLTTSEAYWNAISVFQSGTTAIVDSGTALLTSITNSTVGATFTAPLVDKSTLESQLNYITSHLNKSSIPYSLTVQTDESYYDHFERYYGPLPDGIYPVTHLMGNRLLPRSLFQSNESTAKLMDVAKSITAGNEWTISSLSVNANETVSNATGSTNSVHPAWRDSLVLFTIYSPWDWSSDDEMIARSDRLTNEITPSLEELSPGSASYANEGNYNQKNWQTEFYGPTWKKLNEIKNKWDPKGVFYAQLTPGADDWSEDASGKLCRKN